MIARYTRIPRAMKLSTRSTPASPDALLASNPEVRQAHGLWSLALDFQAWSSTLIGVGLFTTIFSNQRDQCRNRHITLCKTHGAINIRNVRTGWMKAIYIAGEIVAID